MNRSQRRAQAKLKRYEDARNTMPPGKAAAMARLIRNGITPEDLEKEYKAGFEAGFKEASAPMIRSMYAAVLLAGHELYGFGKRRGVRLLNRIDRIITDVLTSQELMEKVFTDLGVEMIFDEPVERAREVG